MNKVIDLIKEYCLPSGAYSNEKYFEEWVDFSPEISEQMKLALFDPQTSGGLLISVEENKADELLENINSRSKIKAEIIGKVVKKGTNKNIITVI